MFKRRVPRTTLARFGRAIYPRGGWIRAVWYVLYRIRRLPDPAYKISRGIAAGVFVSFTPFFGLHFGIAAGLAWVMGGNILASLLATFVGNPVTFPLIAGSAVELGHKMLGEKSRLPLHEVFDAFTRVSIELWANLRAFVLGDPVAWPDFGQFFDRIFIPYLLGGTVLGIVAAIAAYSISRPVIMAYQKARVARLKKKMKARRAATATACDTAGQQALKGDEA